MKKVITLCFVAVMALLAGCRSQIVTVDVVPPDARVIANGVQYDYKSPIFVEASTSKQLVITAYKEGYRDKMYVVDYSLSTLGKIEAWTSILILPALGLLGDNAWMLNENNVTLILDPITPEAIEESKSFSTRVVRVDSQSTITGDSSTSADDGVDQTTDPEAKKIFRQL